MKYITACIGSALWPKIIGTYEAELAPAIEEIVTQQPDVIVNAGAAEGYYAVGLALRCPQAEILAYETESEGRKLLRLLAELNKVAGRISIEDECTTESLESAVRSSERPVIIMDVEGAEQRLLDPAHCPSLKKAAILVELHFYEGKPTGPILEDRFGGTHRIVKIDSTERTFQQLPGVLRFMGALGWRSEVLATLDEGRGETMSWLWMQPLGQTHT